MEFPRPCFSGVWFHAHTVEKRSTLVSRLRDAYPPAGETTLWSGSAHQLPAPGHILKFDLYFYI